MYENIVLWILIIWQWLSSMLKIAAGAGTEIELSKSDTVISTIIALVLTIIVLL